MLGDVPSSWHGTEIVENFHLTRMFRQAKICVDHSHLDVLFVSIATSLNFDTTAGQPSDHLKAVLKVKHSSISMYIFRCSPHFTVKIFPGVNQTVRCKRFTPFQM